MKMMIGSTFTASTKPTATGAAPPAGAGVCTTVTARPVAEHEADAGVGEAHEGVRPASLAATKRRAPTRRAQREQRHRELKPQPPERGCAGSAPAGDRSTARTRSPAAPRCRPRPSLELQRRARETRAQAVDDARIAGRRISRRSSRRLPGKSSSVRPMMMVSSPCPGTPGSAITMPSRITMPPAHVLADQPRAGSRVTAVPAGGHGRARSDRPASCTTTATATARRCRGQESRDRPGPRPHARHDVASERVRAREQIAHAGPHSGASGRARLATSRPRRHLPTCQISRDRIADVAAAAWDRLAGDDDPFLEHAFLAALEASGSVSARAGCVPRFVLARDGGAPGRRGARSTSRPTATASSSSTGAGPTPPRAPASATTPSWSPPSRSRPRPGAGCRCCPTGRRRRRRPAALLRRRARGRRRRTRLVDPLPVLHRGREAGAGARPPSPAPQHAVPLAQPRRAPVRRLRRLPVDFRSRNRKQVRKERRRRRARAGASGPPRAPSSATRDWAALRTFYVDQRRAARRHRRT